MFALRRSVVVAGMVTIFVTLLVTAALGHAERTSSDPEEGAQLQVAPEHLYINLTEPPTSDFRLTVVDGCGHDMVEFAEAKNQTLHAILKVGGQPGKWTVESSVISGLDGHSTDDSFRFTVDGEKDCEAPEPSAAAATTDHSEHSGGGFPLLPVLGAALLLVGAALALRLRS